MRIVVGVDGSPGAQHALEWAIVEGRARDAGVTALLAFGFYGRPFEVQAAAPGLDPEQLEEAARETLKKAVAEVAPGPADRIVERVSDGSPESVAALGWAVEHARCRALPLEVVHAWPFSETQPAEVGELFQVSAQRDQHRREIERLVDGAAGPSESSERGAVTVRFVDGNPVAVLLEAAENASLLVVGSRGQGGIARLLLGSTSAACLLHAPCNVAVVPRPVVSS